MILYIAQSLKSQILLSMGLSVILNCLIVYGWKKKIYQKLGLKSYQSPQRIHVKEIPRLGGFVFIVSLTANLIYSEATESANILRLILLCQIPIIIFGLKEDIFNNVNPIIRMLSLLVVGCLFLINYDGQLPNLSGVPFVSKLILIQGGIGIFFVLSILTIANGMNLIDGVNGLCGLTALSILGTLLFLSYKFSDFMMISLITNIMILFIPFIFFNYPNGQIFLGDLGAYSLGLIVSILTIILFGRHPDLSPWGVFLP